MADLFDAAHMSTFLWTLLYTLLGVVIFSAAFWFSTRITPFSVRKEIEEDQNIALAIILGSVILGLAIIIGSAISG
ncbi:MAG: DUF350 domain-containing protein [Thermoanaerobaculia bacterium]|nr:DUF350 domain-containing protein [Thermoanaerobaculia bacterium]